MYDMRRHDTFVGRRMMHQPLPSDAAWQRRREREEEFLRTAEVVRARRKSQALAAMGIVAAACLMVGGTHVAARTAEPQPPASVIECVPVASGQAIGMKGSVWG